MQRIMKQTHTHTHTHGCTHAHTHASMHTLIGVHTHIMSINKHDNVVQALGVLW